jgi:hypothetical protein
MSDVSGLFETTQKFTSNLDFNSRAGLTAIEKECLVDHINKLYGSTFSHSKEDDLSPAIKLYKLIRKHRASHFSK